MIADLTTHIRRRNCRDLPIGIAISLGLCFACLVIHIGHACKVTASNALCLVTSLLRCDLCLLCCSLTSCCIGCCCGCDHCVSLYSSGRLLACLGVGLADLCLCCAVGCLIGVVQCVGCGVLCNGRILCCADRGGLCGCLAVSAAVWLDADASLDACAASAYSFACAT